MPWNAPRRGRGLGALVLKGEAQNNGSRRGFDGEVGNGALTESEGRTGLNQHGRHSKEKEGKAGKHTLEMQNCLEDEVGQRRGLAQCWSAYLQSRAVG